MLSCTSRDTIESRNKCQYIHENIQTRTQGPFVDNVWNVANRTFKLLCPKRSSTRLVSHTKTAIDRSIINPWYLFNNMYICTKSAYGPSYLRGTSRVNCPLQWPWVLFQRHPMIGNNSLQFCNHREFTAYNHISVCLQCRSYDESY